MTITATPNNGYGVATIKIDGEDLPKDDFVNNQFTIDNVTSDVEVKVTFQAKEDKVYFYSQKDESMGALFSVQTQITSGYEAASELTLDFLSSNQTEAHNIIMQGADLCIEITGITSGGATPKYLYITKGRAGTEILDWVELENGRGTLEIQTGDTDTTFSLVATSTQPQTNQTE